MRHFFSSLILFVAITSATLSTSSCSNDEGNIAEKAIVGKWKLEKKGSSPWTGKEKTLLFQEDGTVDCHSDQINYQGIYAINNVSVKEEIVYCDLTITKTLNNHSTQIHYWCTLQNNVMILDNRDVIAFVDATESYIRIN